MDSVKGIYIHDVLHLIPFLNISLCLLKDFLMLLNIISNDIPGTTEELVKCFAVGKLLHFQGAQSYSRKPCARAPGNTFYFKNALPGDQETVRSVSPSVL